MGWPLDSKLVSAERPFDNHTGLGPGMSHIAKHSVSVTHFKSAISSSLDVREPGGILGLEIEIIVRSVPQPREVPECGRAEEVTLGWGLGECGSAYDDHQ